jgi:hypothetical protein
VQRHEPSLRSPPAVRPLKGEVHVHSIKVRALPYLGALTFIASMAGYFGGK